MTHRTAEKIYFVSFIIESYAKKHRISGAKTLERFDRCGITDWLYEYHDVLHTVSVDYVIDQIENKLEKK